MISKQKKLQYMIDELVEINNVNSNALETYKDKDLLFKTLRTISIPHALTDEYITYEEEYLQELAEDKGVLRVEEIKNISSTKELFPRIWLYQGDITRLETDAIVNAANEKLLGCFVPGHACIDNAIHMAAGLGLRNACNDVMRKQGNDEAVGRAKITEAFHLPSKYVIHTVGPNVHDMPGTTWEEVAEKLASCYTSILEEANKKEDIKNIVFCSISTGLFGVPVELGAFVALRTIREYLENKENHFEEVIIDVFREEDYYEYCKAVSRL